MIKRIRSKARRLSTAAIVVSAIEVMVPRAKAATLPIESSIWVTSGTARSIRTDTSLTVNQLTNKAIFNWDSFNIGVDGRVVFNQPDANSIALNRIHDANPSQIFGSLQANGQLYLLNQNGFLFGSTARVNVGGLVASSLNITDDVFNNGLLSATKNLSPALQAAGNMAGVLVEPGARITTNAAGQRILLAAKTVDNRGTIVANEGQVILAAGEKVYVNASDDPALRGLLVEVDGGGDVFNSGTVTAERGNITAIGLAIHQNGRMTATTSVSKNGSIRLLARDTVVTTTDGVSKTFFDPQHGGSVTLGANSITEVNVEARDTVTAVDEQTQTQSSVEMAGKTIEFAGGSQVLAAGGNLTVTAASNPSTSRAEGIVDTGARIRVDSGSLIDVSGSTATTSVTRNLVTVELRANELANSPQQRDGVLRGQTVVVDSRVVTAAGNKGTDLADVSGQIALIQRDVNERTAKGGTVKFDTNGDIVVANNATIDVSGGAVNYTGGLMRTTQLIKADGSTVDIGKASASATYAGLINPTYKQVSDRWGIVKLISAPGLGSYEAGYVQGMDAGSIQFMGNAMSLNGNFIGTAINGANQRTADTMAKGGQFVVGINAATAAAQSFRAPQIELVKQAIPLVADINTSLPAGSTLFLSTDFLRNGFSRIQLASDQGISVDAGVPLNVQAGGSMAFVSPHINIDSDITIASGQISAASVAPTTLRSNQSIGLFVSENVTLDVRGRWINDTLVPLDQKPTEALYTNGGSISLQQSVTNGTLQIGDDVALQASGGGWLKTSGAVAGGAGGSISIKSNNLGTADQNQRVVLGDNLQLDAFGVQGASGGSFELRVPRLQIAENQQWLTAQQVATNETSGGALNIGSALFSDFGFAKFALQADSHALASDATKTTLSVATGTAIDLSPQSLMLISAASNQSSGTSVFSFAGKTDLPVYQAKPAQLTLLTTTNLSNRNAYGGLRIESGAKITGNADSTVNMTSMGDLTLAGAIDIASGAVNMTISKSAVDNEQAFVNRQLTLEDTASINVAGAAILKPNDLQLRQGVVLNGGSVTATALIGSVDVKAGADINVSGTQAVLDIQPPNGGAYSEKTISSVGGSLSLQAAESIVMQGTLEAHGGVSQGTENTGGILSVALTRTLPTNGSDAATFPSSVTFPRTVQVSNGNIAAPISGLAVLDANAIANSGVDTLRLSADNRIAIDTGVDLKIQGGVTLAAPELAALGNGTGKISAEYLTVGQSTVTAAAKDGTGQLAFQADQINLIGSVALQATKTTFSSNGDINLRGDATTPVGLDTHGDITLRAERISPTTGSKYFINASGADSTVRIEQAGASPGTPLSVAGSLTITAANIQQGGTLLAPFGSIALNATKSLQLLDGSLTSVSGAGSVLPYGRVDNGDTWFWRNPVTAMPQRSVTLNGSIVNMASGAVVDVSGGGDLLAYQFTPGTGGKVDVLAGDANGMYAIIPSLAGQSTPYDPEMWKDSSLTTGSSVYIAGGAGVPAGVYQLLPARYALMPGAYLVSAVNGYSDLQPGATAATPDGANVVAGYLSFGNETNAAARYSGFAIRPGSYARQLAQYEDQLASSFFPRNAGDATTHITVPNDAGKLVVAVQQSLNVFGTVRGQAAGDGINASVEISAPAIEVDSPGSGNSQAGVAQLSSNTLKDWHIGSLLLGGRRNNSGAVSVDSSTVTVRDGADLVADEVVLAATQAINVEAGASVASNSGKQPNLALDDSRFSDATALQLTGANADKAAVLAVSDLAYLVTERDAAQASDGATINVASGATIATRGSIAADASGTTSLATGSVHADHASWALGAKHLAIGDASAATDGLAIDAALMSNLQNARAITLSSGGYLDIIQPAILGAGTSIKELNIKVARINNLTDGVSSSFTADRIMLTGGFDTTPALSSGTGNIALNAKQIELSKGITGLSGFGNVALNASDTVTGTGEGGIATASDLSITSSAITTASGAHTTIHADGTVHLTTTSEAAIPTLNTLNTGGTLDIGGRDIVDAAKILMPSGVVTLTATNSLSLQDGAAINVAGMKPLLATTGANGGAIHLNANGSAITTAGNSSLDVSGGVKADAGIITLHAAGVAELNGAMLGHADSGQAGAGLEVQAQSIANFAPLTQQAKAGGFTEQQSYRVAAGDLAVGSDSSIVARNIELIADAGNVTVDGALTAHSDTKQSSIVVNAKNNVVIGGTATLNASALDVAAQRGGDIELATTNGHIHIAASADIQAQGAGQSGSLTLRAPATSSDFNLDSLPANLSKIDSVVLEPMKDYALTSTTLGAADFDTIRSDLTSYIATAKPAMLTRLGLNSANNIYVRPYADVTSNSNVTVSSLDFGSSANLWRFDGQPAVMSIRATGNLTIAGALNDGVTAVDTEIGPGLDILDTPQSGKYSTSFNFVAGADLNSASNKAVVTNSGKDVVLSDNAIVRTGTGDIDVTASQNIKFGNGASIVTVGNKVTNTLLSADGATTYLTNGGDVHLAAGNDVVGSVVQQAVNDWQTRQAYATPEGTTGMYWGIDIGSFGWNVGALGGGDINIKAGRDAVDVSAAVVDSAAPDAVDGHRLSLGGGNLSLITGGDIDTGYFYVGKGEGALRAWGALGFSRSRSLFGKQLGTWLLAGDASYRVVTTGNLLFEGLVQPSLLLPTRDAELGGLVDSFGFFTRYGEQSRLQLQSTGGSVTLNALEDSSPFGNYIGNVAQLLKALPATLSVQAFGGDINFAASFNTAPSSQGDLTLYAAQDIVAGRNGISMSDVSSLLRTATNVSFDADYATSLQDATGEVIHKDDPTTAHIAAGRDIQVLSLNLPKAAEVQAGRDIVDLSMHDQQSGLATTTLISAGRDVRMTTSTTAANTAEIVVGGAGTVEVLAGRNIDLGFTKGLYTTGNLNNGNLPANQGADLIAIAGLNQSLGIDASASSTDFVATVIGNNADLRTQLVNYMIGKTGNASLDFASASAAFRALPLQQQIPLATKILFSELVTSGHEANETPALGFTRGFAALASLFPESQTDQNPYAGNVSLPFSRIYTLNGGNIAVLAPGGKIDVGLANPPAALASLITNRPASELGIVAQGAGDVDLMANDDVLVNTSRVFTLGGGNIAIWSSKGNIDAGKGAKSAISAPPPQLIVDAAGNITINFASAVNGSGIRTISTGDIIKPGNVDLMAPSGFVNAGDAGIGSSGNLNIAAQRVVGLDNIQVGGQSTGVPPETSGLGASLAAVTTTAASSTNATANSVTESQAAEKSAAPIAESALSWLEVFVIGLGEENCKQDDVECLKRQTSK